jgi:hypothetical protein
VTGATVVVGAVVVVVSATVLVVVSARSDPDRDGGAEVDDGSAATGTDDVVDPVSTGVAGAVDVVVGAVVVVESAGGLVVVVESADVLVVVGCSTRPSVVVVRRETVVAGSIVVAGIGRAATGASRSAPQPARTAAATTIAIVRRQLPSTAT